MKKFYLTGQNTFENRGCEALVRSTVELLKRQFGEVEVLVPSSDIDRDAAQWPEAKEHGVRFVRAYMPWFSRYWVNFQRLPFRMIKQAAWPFPMPHWLRDQLEEVDAVVAIGGDNYSLDYRIPSPVVALDALAMDMGKPVCLWGASVGPFEKEPDFIDPIKKHLNRFDRVAVRESVSYKYLAERLGIRDVKMMPDPAFVLQPEELEVADFWPTEGGEGVLGLNVSNLIERYKRSGQDLRGEVINFVRHAVRERGFGVLLISHVGPLDRPAAQGDVAYMQTVLQACADLGSYVRMIPCQLNAAHTKSVISKVRFFIGARTHATIAALSSEVPTVSISYSVKARGINLDLFGTESMVLDAKNISAESLNDKLQWLIKEETAVRQTLKRRIPEYHARLRDAAHVVADMMS